MSRANNKEKNIKDFEIKKDVYSFSDYMKDKHGEEGVKKLEEQAWAEYHADILLEARKEAGMTQQELAEKLGMDKSYVSKVERGMIMPSVSLFYEFIEALGKRVEII